ncbi:hypothetical protein SEPCBS119000_003638 [Sporothrix epigloea]|uniref:Uncharacterized protein n=1 Tax=Sporothrix epigloea TaxID=1892477 RepID=A0ABP0DQJ0_9PEZI
MAEVMPRRSHELFDSISADDFETASIRSAAPSYRSEAPTLHYTVPRSRGSSLLPPYTAPPAGSAERALAGPARNGASARRVSPGSAASGTAAGSVFVMPARINAVHRDDSIPDLSRFHMPAWSTISTSPNARLYHSVALRRVAAAEHASATAEIGNLMRRLAVLEQMREEEAAAVRRMERANASRAAAAMNANSNSNSNSSSSSNSSVNASSSNSNAGSSSSSAVGRPSTGNGSFRPMEDPYLVGETAARRARADRLTRESLAHGEDALHREDRRWDWFLGQVKNRHGNGRLRRRMDSSAHRHHHGRRV